MRNSVKSLRFKEADTSASLPELWQRPNSVVVKYLTVTVGYRREGIVLVGASGSLPHFWKEPFDGNEVAARGL